MVRRHVSSRAGVCFLLLVALATAAGCATVGQAAGSTVEGRLAVSQPSTMLAATRTTTLPPPPVTVNVSPPDGALDVRPDSPVQVEVRDGRAVAITVSSVAGPVEGRFEGTTFRPNRPFEFGQTYSIGLTVENTIGERRNVNSGFVTVDPGSAIVAEAYPNEGDIVGVGMPIIVWLSEPVPVQERAGLAAGIVVRSNPPVTGAWRFISDDTIHWRPSVPWPAHAQVTVTADLAGHSAAGKWFTESWARRFSVGEDQRVVVDSASHQMLAMQNGRPIRQMPISTGRDAYPTASGIDLIMEKWATFEMDSTSVGITGADAYHLVVDNALRITNSGTFIHAAPWNGLLGEANTSHGCINASSSDAAWLMAFVQIGDPVEILNTGERINPGNGWGDWNISYADWLVPEPA